MQPLPPESTGPLPEHALSWLEAAQRRIVRDVEPLLSDRAREVGMRRLRILQLIPSGGIRQTDLASRALITKQALGPVVDALEAEGLLERTVDPSDARAWVVTVSAEGTRVAESLNRAIAVAEQRLAAEFGEADVASFLRIVRLIGHGVAAPVGR